MHILQPKHVRLKPEEAEKFLLEFNISKKQLPRISHKDPALPEGSVKGDIIKIERKREGEKTEYFRIVEQ